MASGAVKTGARIAVLVLLILALAFGGALWFDYLGLFDVKDTFAPAFSLVGLSAPERIEALDDPLLLDRMRLDKQLDALLLREEELEQKEEELRFRLIEIQAMAETIEEKELALAEKEKSFNERLKQYENKNENLRQAARYFTGMPPAAAVARLMEMEDQDVIDILRTAETLAVEAGEASLVAFWFSLMPAERAAVLNRKMLRRPEG